MEEILEFGIKRENEERRDGDSAGTVRHFHPHVAHGGRVEVSAFGGCCHYGHLGRFVQECIVGSCRTMWSALTMR